MSEKKVYVNFDFQVGEDNTDSITISPLYLQLKEELEEKKNILSDLLLQKDELQFIICKNIETDYMLKVGYLEMKVYKADCKLRRIKRKLELIQARINREEEIDLASIESILDAEFEEYQKNIDMLIKNIREAVSKSMCPKLSEEDNKLLRNLYYKIVKALHPDLHPDNTEKQLKFFYRANLAYENGDLVTLKIIWELISNNNLPENSDDSIDQLKESINYYEKMIVKTKEDIEKIKTNYPYTMQDLLNDEEKLNSYKQQLEEEYNTFNDVAIICEKRLEELLRQINE